MKGIPGSCLAAQACRVFQFVREDFRRLQELGKRGDGEEDDRTVAGSPWSQACQAGMLGVGSFPWWSKSREGRIPAFTSAAAFLEGSGETAMESVLQLLAEISANTHIPILLIGGHALQAYGVTRQTLDVDVLIAEADAETMDAALRRVGYSQVARSEIFARYRHPSMVLADVDVLYVDSETASKMLQQATPYAVGETRCLVPALSHLLGMKLHAIRTNPRREARDFADIVELIRSNPEGISKDEVHSLCTKYAPEGLWEKLEAALWKTY